VLRFSAVRDRTHKEKAAQQSAHFFALRQRSIYAMRAPSRSANASRHKGVHKTALTVNLGWQAIFRKKSFGTYEHESDAARAWNIEAKKNGSNDFNDVEEPFRVPEKRFQSVSKYVGVQNIKKYPQWWTAHFGKPRRHLGQCASAEDAARAVNIEAKRLGCALVNDVPEPYRIPTKVTTHTSQWKGVSWNAKNKRWNARCRRMHLGTFKREDEDTAARCYNVGARQVGLNEFNDISDPFDYYTGPPLKTSNWRGVSWSNNFNRWQVDCTRKYLGSFKVEDEETAARCYNIEAKRIGLTEFNDIPDPFDCQLPGPRSYTSKWRGVCWCKEGPGKWIARCKGKYLGFFKYDDEEGAARCYNVEARRLGMTELNDVPDAPEISKHDRFFKKTKRV